MCYSEFNDILPAIAALDADVITIETSRSDMELLDAFAEFAYPNEIGPGVYDIHSPRIPDSAEMVKLLNKALAVIPARRLWVNPDCGLKTRNWAETEAALANMLTATRQLRTAGGHGLIPIPVRRHGVRLGRQTCHNDVFMTCLPHHDCQTFSAEEKPPCWLLKALAPPWCCVWSNWAFRSFAQLATEDADVLAQRVAALVGGSCWRNSPQARAAPGRLHCPGQNRLNPPATAIATQLRAKTLPQAPISLKTACCDSAGLPVVFYARCHRFVIMAARAVRILSKGIAMTRMVNCIKLGREAGAWMPPMPGELGKKLYDSVSKEAWQAWLKLQTMLINENRLNLADRAPGNT